MFNILLDLTKAEMLLLQSLFLDFMCHYILLHVYVKLLQRRSSLTSSLFVLYLLSFDKSWQSAPSSSQQRDKPKRESAE